MSGTDTKSNAGVDPKQPPFDNVPNSMEDSSSSSESGGSSRMGSYSQQSASFMNSESRPNATTQSSPLGPSLFMKFAKRVAICTIVVAVARYAYPKLMVVLFVNKIEIETCATFCNKNPTNNAPIICFRNWWRNQKLRSQMKDCTTWEKNHSQSILRKGHILSNFMPPGVDIVR